jgi:hypothetical protein
MLAACGGNQPPRAPDLARLPLVPGAKVVAKVQTCDTGANAFCAIHVVVVDRRFRSSDDLLESEHRHLRKLGWTGATGDSGDEKAADSPGHKLRVTYATASGDLKDIDLKVIKRPRPIAIALARTLFDRQAAMSMMLEIGTS